MLIAYGYTFSEYFPNFWYCTKKGKGCKAKAKTYSDGSIQAIVNDHDHKPPSFRIFNGDYVKLD